MDDYTNDFIVTSNIKIADYMDRQNNNNRTPCPRKDGDYTEFIMKVINEIMKITQENE